MTAAAEGGGSAMISVPFAISLGLLASFIQSLGLTIQRKSHLIAARLPLETRPPEWRQPLWVVGFLIFIVANIGGTIFQIGALPIVMLAPLGAVSLLYNALLAKFLLADALGPMMIGGTALILIGAVLIGYFGAIQEPPHTIDELLALFGRPPFIALATFLTMAFSCVILVAHLAEWQLVVHLQRPPPRHRHKHHRAKKAHARPRRWSAPSLAPLDEVSETTSGVATPVLAVRDQQLRQQIQNRPGPTLGGVAAQSMEIESDATPTGQRYGAIPQRRPHKPSLPQQRERSQSPGEDASIARTKILLAVAFAAVSGTLSGLCLLLAKSGVELLVLTFGEGRNQFNRLGSWSLVVIMIVAALAQLWYLNKALKMADPTLVCPLAFCFYNTSSIALGLVYFDQISNISALSLCLIVLGIAVLLTGVFIVSMRPQDEVFVTDDEDVASPSSAESTTTPFMSHTDPTEAEALLANVAGIAGPHLPPPPVVTVESPRSSSDLALENGEGDKAKRRSRKHRRTGSASSSSSSGSSSSDSRSVAGLGLHLPSFYDERQDAHESRHSETTGSGKRRSHTPRRPATSGSDSLAGMRSNTVPATATYPTASSSRRSSSLYSSIINRGLSIGISPSSPGFHIGPFSPDDDAEGEGDGGAAGDGSGSSRAHRHNRRARQYRAIGPRRTVSEADVEPRRPGAGASTGSGPPGGVPSAQEASGVLDDEEMQAAPMSSGYRLALPSLDTTALTDRLSALRDRQRRFGAGIKEWWIKNVQGEEDWRAAERRRLLEDG